jgi:large subunit ribosomal protein L9
MKVILLEHIRGIGRVGEVKEVSDGYARNFLLARGKAKPATDGIIKEVTALHAKKLELAAMARHQIEALAAALNGTRIELTEKANAKGTLFAAIPEITIDGRTFTLPEPIKTTGDHPVVIELGQGMTTKVIVAVSAR